MSNTLPSDPVANAQATIDANIRPTGTRSLTAELLRTTLISILMAVGAVKGAALVGLNGTTLVVPGGSNASVCLASGQSVTLPTGATPNTEVTIDDCSQGVAISTPLASPETVFASSDATIAGAPSYPITLALQSARFRKTAAGPWQPE